MCVIINKKPGIIFPEHDIEAALDNNPDGFGIMWVQDGRVKVEKLLTAWPHEIMDLQKKVKHKQAVMHFRFTTHGATDISNVHPFPVCNMEEDGIDIWMAHNGTISGADPIKSESDTRAFIREYLKPTLSINPDLLYVPGFQKFVNEFIDWSKLSFLTSDDNIVVINEESGDERHGCWVSNTYSFESWYRYGSYTSPGYGRRSSGGTVSHSTYTTRGWDSEKDDDDVDEVFTYPASACGYNSTSRVTTIGTPPAEQGKVWRNGGEEISAEELKYMVNWEIELFCESHPNLAAKVIEDLILS